jgi:hypothetical protein
MVAASAQRYCASILHLSVELSDTRVTLFDMEGIGDRHITDIRDSTKIIRIDPGHMMDLSHEAGHVADFARAMAGPRSSLHPAVEWDTNECNIQV